MGIQQYCQSECKVFDSHANGGKPESSECINIPNLFSLHNMNIQDKAEVIPVLGLCWWDESFSV